MRYKKVVPYIISILLVCLILTVIIVAVVKRNEDKYAEIGVPVGEGQLSWGMSADEITEILGEPTSIEEEEYGSTLTYTVQMSSDIGNVSELTLSVAKNDLDDGNGVKLDRGLCYIGMIVEDTTKDLILERLSDFYGTLSEDGGSTQMELDFKQVNPNYFIESHFRDGWKVTNLPTDEYERLETLFNANRDGVLDQRSLVWFSIGGIDEGETYACRVDIYAELLTFLKAEKDS